MSHTESNNISIKSQQDPYSDVDIQDYQILKVYLDMLGTTIDKANDLEYNAAIDCRDNYLDPHDDLQEENFIYDHINQSFLNNCLETMYK
jgi:hypothetical protein